MTEPETTVAPEELDVSPLADDVAEENLRWLAALRGDGPTQYEAVTALWAEIRRATQAELARRPDLHRQLGSARVAEIVESAADEATASVLTHLDEFRGHSRFLTWAWKFGVNCAYAETRRTMWRDRTLVLDEHRDPADPAPSPEAWAQATDLADAVRLAIDTVLTPHQRAVALAIIVEGVPSDVLADRLGTTRNALYKTVHDARGRLRAELRARGYLGPGEGETDR